MTRPDTLRHHGDEVEIIELTKGMQAIVDRADYHELALWKWHYITSGYACRRKTMGFRNSRIVLMHRELLHPKMGEDVDHINGNKLDNRRCNLRICTRSMNMGNQNIRKQTKKKTSKYKGVSWARDRNRWEVQIACNTKKYKGGYHSCEDDAAVAYNVLAIRLFGEFAKLNWVGGVDA